MVWYLAAISGPAFSAYKLHARAARHFEKSAWCGQCLCLGGACRTSSGSQRQLQAVKEEIAKVLAEHYAQQDFAICSSQPACNCLFCHLDAVLQAHLRQSMHKLQGIKVVSQQDTRPCRCRNGGCTWSTPPAPNFSAYNVQNTCWYHRPAEGESCNQCCLGSISSQAEVHQQLNGDQATCGHQGRQTWSGQRAVIA